ncbi:MAG: hypothetical protein R3A49_11875 [Acidimicrobiia bacterium]
MGSTSSGTLIERPGGGTQDPHVLYYDRTRGELRHAWQGCQIGGCT